MYEAFYGFQEKPFNLTPDPKYLYLSAKHSEAYAHLDFGLRERGGFVVITGEVGTGKTTLCRYFLERLDENTVSAFILYPALTAMELFRAICTDLGIEGHGWTAKEWVDMLHGFLLESREKGKNIVLVIDEAQNLDLKVLEQIRLISNLETTTEKLIQIVLIGQSELGDILYRSDMRQLAQRVTARYHLGPLNGRETANYIQHRLGVVGGAGKVSFTPAALRAVHRFSKGIPRLINLVCDRALLAGFVTGRREISGKVIRRAAKELEQVQGHRPAARWYHSWRARGALGGLFLAALALAFRPEAQRLFPWTSGSDEIVHEVVAEDEPAPQPNRDSSAGLEEDRAGTEELESRLRTLSRALSLRGSAGALLARWGLAMGGDVAAFTGEETLRSIGGRAGLEVTELRTHVGQLRRLNLPTVLELFHTARSDTCFATLVRLDDRTAVLSFGPGDELRVPLSSLERYWTRRAHVFWKDFEQLDTLGPKDPQVVAWVEERLQELGFWSDEGDAFPHGLQAALARFQSTSFLVADGIAGPRTRMSLYSLSGLYAMPRLQEP